MELHNQATAHGKIVAAIVRSVLSLTAATFNPDAVYFPWRLPLQQPLDSRGVSKVQGHVPAAGGPNRFDDVTHQSHVAHHDHDV
jgi:hypothetical protein